MPPRAARASQSKPPAGLTKQSPRPKAGTLTYQGEKYKLSAEIGVWPLLQFARAAEAGWKPEDPRGLASLHAFLESAIDPGDWPRFQEDMIKNKMVDIFGLMTAAQQAVNDMIDRQQANGQAVPDEPALDLSGMSETELAALVDRANQQRAALSAGEAPAGPPQIEPG